MSAKGSQSVITVQVVPPLVERAMVRLPPMKTVSALRGSTTSIWLYEAWPCVKFKSAWSSSGLVGAWPEQAAEPQPIMARLAQLAPPSVERKTSF